MSGFLRMLRDLNVTKQQLDDITQQGKVIEFEGDNYYKSNSEIHNTGVFALKDILKGDIIEEDDKYSIYIKKRKDVLPWKDFNKNMAVSVEYNLEY